MNSKQQRITIDGVRSSDVNVVFSISQGIVLSPFLFVLYTSYLPIIHENTIAGHMAIKHCLMKYLNQVIECQLNQRLINGHVGSRSRAHASLYLT